jgi:hypothetical protein
MAADGADRATADSLPGRALAGVVTNSVTTVPWWLLPYQSPTKTAPAPVTTANTHAPVIDAADARVCQEPIVCLLRVVVPMFVPVPS